jgi:hypothetical protein
MPQIDGHGLPAAGHACRQPGIVRAVSLGAATWGARRGSRPDAPRQDPPLRRFGLLRVGPIRIEGRRRCSLLNGRKDNGWCRWRQ